MAEQIKFLNLDGLQTYDAKIKEFINSKITVADAKTFKAVGIEGNKLKFYTNDPFTAGVDTPAYEVTLPTQDLSNFMGLVADAVANNVAIFDEKGQVIDSGVAIASLAKQADVDSLKSTIGTVADGKTVVQMISDAQTAATYDDTAVKADIAANAAAIEAEATRAKATEGDLTALGTTAKTDLVTAINEVRNSVAAGGTAAAITMDTTTTTEGYLKSYTIKQGDNTIGVIDIPKELMAVSGQVVVNPEGQEPGTYIELTIQNGDPVYVDVASLIDNYVAKANATQVQIIVDAAKREISAVIVEGAVGTAELADDAVTTAKIADANVSKAKLAADVQASLVKADSAVQSVASGTANGTISVDGTDVAVKGLGSAAYTDSSAYDAAGAANAVLGTETDTADTNTVHGAKAAAAAASSAAAAAKAAADNTQTDVDELSEKVGTVADGKTVVQMISDAQAAATYDDTAVRADITKNAEAIQALEDSLTPITTAEINALFA